MTGRVLSLLCVTISLTSAMVIYVHPKGQKGQCRNRTPCDTLSHYATDNGSYFKTSNMTFVFLSGQHLLEENITFAGVRDLTLTTKDDGLVVERGETTIECAWGKENIGFLFKDISELCIDDLMISRCSRLYYLKNVFYNYTNIQAGLCFRNISNLKMNAVSVQKSTGYGVFLSQIFGESWIESCTFQQNCALNDAQMGGNAALVYQDCGEYEKASASVQIVGSKFLDGNSHMFASGLVLLLHCPNTHVNISLVGATILNNTEAAVTPRSCILPAHPSNGGNLAVIFDSHQNLNSSVTRVSNGMNRVNIMNSTISLGRACFGGGIFLYSTLGHSFSISIENSELSDNTAIDGAGVYVQLYSYWENGRKHNSSPTRNTNNFLTMTACSFTGNQLLDSSNLVAGVAMTFTSSIIQPQFVILLSDCHFLKNGIRAPPAERSEGEQHPSSVVGVVLASSVRVHVKNCIFEWNGITAISGFRSVVMFSENVTISHNTGQNGGGIALREASYVTLTPQTTIFVSHNQANSFAFGGGIYIEDHKSRLNEPCFYQIDFDDDMSVQEALEDTKIRLVNNTVYLAGSQLYGGRVDSCFFPYGTFDELFEYQSENESTDHSKISSDPKKIRHCEGGVPLRQVNTYYGVYFNVSLNLTGQRGGVTPGKVVFTTSSQVNVSYPYRYKSNNGCTNYSVAVSGNSSNLVVLNISIEQGTPSQLLTNHTSLEVKIIAPPLGFVATSEHPFYKCIEHPNLTAAHFHCKFSKNQSYIERPPPYWLGYTPQDGFSLYANCPENYCKTTNYTKIQTDNETFLDHQDDQCMNYHTGMVWAVQEWTEPLIWLLYLSQLHPHLIPRISRDLSRNCSPCSSVCTRYSCSQHHYHPGNNEWLSVLHKPCLHLLDDSCA